MDYVKTFPLGKEEPYTFYAITSTSVGRGFRFGLYDHVSCGMSLSEAPFRKLSEEERKRIDLPLLFGPMSLPAMAAVDYFLQFVREHGQFIALPYQEIPKATGGKITFSRLQDAVEEGFLMHYSLIDGPFRKQEIVEVSNKFRPPKTPSCLEELTRIAA